MDDVVNLLHLSDLRPIRACQEVLCPLPLPVVAPIWPPACRLAALIGARDVLTSAIVRISHDPTFKGDAYSLAAAPAVLTIYGEQDVPAQVASFGDNLRRASNATYQALELDAEVIGPPFR